MKLEIEEKSSMAYLSGELFSVLLLTSRLIDRCLYGKWEIDYLGKGACRG